MADNISVGTLEKRTYPVVMLGAWLDSCALWRLFMPHMNLPGSGFFTFAGAPAYDRIASNEVAVVQRCYSKIQADFITVLGACGLRVVYDLDDNIWDIPPSNPVHRMFVANRAGFNTCIQLADMVTVSTLPLAKAVKRNVKPLINTRTGKAIPIRVCENRIEERMFVAPREQTFDECVVGWAGSDSHAADLALVENALEFAMKDPNVIVEFRGGSPARKSRLVGMPQYRHGPWMPVVEYASRMPLWKWNIALAPIQDNEFNRSKSNIKPVESGYCGVPCLMSAVEPYMDLCYRDPSGDLKWLLCLTPGQWNSKLQDLIYDPAKRDYYGKLLQKISLEHFSFRRPHEGWINAFAEARTL
jgi:hypothetical protein